MSVPCGVRGRGTESQDEGMVSSLGEGSVNTGGAAGVGDDKPMK